MTGALTLAPARAQAPLASPPYHTIFFSDGAPAIAFHRAGEAYLLRFPDLADFEVSADGLSATCRPAPHVRDATPEHLYVNQVLPLMRSRRGEAIYHGAAVATPAGALACLGAAGRGKSTLAAAVARAGHAFLADDAVWARPAGGHIEVVPGAPALRLWEDSRAALVPRIAPAAPLHFTSKHRLAAAPRLPHADRPAPLRAIYLLGEGASASVTIARTSAREALLALLAHAFVIDIADRDLVARHFATTARIANAVPCFQLDYPRRYETLEPLIATLEEHASAEGVQR